MIHVLQIATQDTEFLRVFEDGVLTSVSWLNDVLFIGAGLLITINLYRWFRKDFIEINKLELSLNKCWIIVLAYTLAHLYCSVNVVRSTKDFLRETKDAYKDISVVNRQKELLWNKITLSGKFSFRRMERRQLSGQMQIPFSEKRISFYKISVDDISNWIYFGLALLILNGVADFKQNDKRKFRRSLLIASLLALINWTIGSVWTAALSNLLN